MTAVTEQLKAVGETVKREANKAPEVLEREADRARASAERAIQAIRDRVASGESLDRALEQVRQRGGEVSRKATETARHHPVVVGLAGVGVAAIGVMAARSMNGNGSGHGMAEKARQTAGTVADQARSAAETASDAAEEARGRYYYLRRTRPLLFGILALVASKAIRVALRETDVATERATEAMDDAAEQLADEGQEAVSRATEGRQVASPAATV